MPILASLQQNFKSLGGKSWYEMDLPLLEEIALRRKNDLYEISPLLDKVELYIREKKFNDALNLLKEMPSDIPIVNRLLIECVYELGLWDDVIRLLPKPRNQKELGILVDAFCKKERFDIAKKTITCYKRDVQSYDKGFIDALEKRLDAERKMGMMRGSIE